MTQRVPVSVGRIVHYELSADDVERIQGRRSALAHIEGNRVHEGDVVPLLVTVVWPPPGDQPGCVNGRAFLDGDDSLWVTSALEGEGPGHWRWPPRVG